jgi:hypothetical protein
MDYTYRSKEFKRAINEYFDIEDTLTRKSLFSINEEDQNQVLISLTSRLYDNIVNKVDDIDFGDIPQTKGDITKLPNYEKLNDCIVIMKGILKEYKQDTKPVDTIDLALENIEKRKETFQRAYQLNVELPIVLYNTMSLAVISSISFMIAACIEFIKTPTQESFDIIVDKVALAKTKQNLLFTNLERFNEACKKGEIDNAMEHVIKMNVKNFTGPGMIIGGVALVGLLFTIIPIMRELIFFFYYSRTRVSDYFDAQADLLQMNAYNLEMSSEKDAGERKKIVAKQLKIVELFRKISNALIVSNKECEVKATKDIVETNKKMKINDVVDELPDSAASSLF